MLSEPAFPSSILAFVTTLHLGCAALRNHRSAIGAPLSSLTLVSLALAFTPWFFPSLWGLAFGLGVHGAWFAACEALATRAPAAPPARQAPRPAAVPAPAAKAAPARPAPASRGFVQTPILATFDESPDIKTIRMLRPEGFDFEAGQFVPVRLRVDGKEYVRCYSISSSPGASGFLEVSVKRQGVVSNALHATARPGAILSIKAPNGAFKYPAGDDRPIVLLAGGVGITPLISMLRHAVHTEPSRPVTLVYGAQYESSLAFRGELDFLARRHPQLKVVYSVTKQSPPQPSFYPGRIDASLLRAMVPDLVHSIAFICGPAPMIDGMKALLAGMGVPPAQIRHEKFEAAVAAAAGAKGQMAAVAEPVGVARGAGGSRAGGGAPRTTKPSAGCAMRCLPGDVTVSVRVGETLLEAAEGAGVEMPSLCRAGVCGTCRVRVTDGEVDCESTTLDSGELGQGYVLACVAQARTDCTVQL